MSKIHVLESDDGYAYKVAIHSPIPAGNNAAGRSWKDCALALYDEGILEWDGEIPIFGGRISGG